METIVRYENEIDRAWAEYEHQLQQENQWCISKHLLKTMGYDKDGIKDGKKWYDELIKSEDGK